MTRERRLVSEDLLIAEDGSGGLTARMFDILTKILDVEHDLTPVQIARSLKCRLSYTNNDLNVLEKKKMVKRVKTENYDIVMLTEKGKLMQILLNSYDIFAEYAEDEEGLTSDLITIISNPAQFINKS